MPENKKIRRFAVVGENGANLPESFEQISDEHQI
jgi:hypothetical protein